jgi:hypothetical protein
MGHPAIVAGIEPKSASGNTSFARMVTASAYGEVFALWNAIAWAAMIPLPCCTVMA